jgi:hypothetical protein
MGSRRRCLRALRDRRWIAALCSCLLLSAGLVSSHGHPIERNRGSGSFELDAGCRVCLQGSPLRAAAAAAALLLPLARIERAGCETRRSAPEPPLLALGHPTRAPPLA